MTQDEVEAVLHRIQQFDPIGVGARDPAECLRIQLAQVDSQTPWIQEARTLVAEHVNLLANRDYNQLMRRMKLSESELQQVIHKFLHPAHLVSQCLKMIPGLLRQLFGNILLDPFGDIANSAKRCQKVM